MKPTHVHQNPIPLLAFDKEADGPCSGLYSMISFGLVDVSRPECSFYAELRPITDAWIPEALAVSGFTREQTLAFEDPQSVMNRLARWLDDQGWSQSRVGLISDNPGFDFQWMLYYTHRYLGHCPFGHSARRIGDVYAGLSGNIKDTKGWKRLRQTRHTHHALDDARGVAEAWARMQKGIRPSPNIPHPKP